jgi:hypothetical protein
MTHSTPSSRRGDDFRSLAELNFQVHNPTFPIAFSSNNNVVMLLKYLKGC